MTLPTLTVENRLANSIFLRLDMFDMAPQSARQTKPPVMLGHSRLRAAIEFLLAVSRYNRPTYALEHFRLYENIVSNSRATLDLVTDMMVDEDESLIIDRIAANPLTVRSITLRLTNAGRGRSVLQNDSELEY